jgi:GT2 family glycosyltransferase
MADNSISLVWVVLTMADRPAELDRATASLRAGDVPGRVLVVSNGGGPIESSLDGVDVVELAPNAGVSGGRDRGTSATSEEVVGFLDDDAELRGDTDRIILAFSDDPRLGAVALRLVDEYGETARRHVPRTGGKAPQASGEAAYFLGGACAIRRTAYEEVGGYFTDLFYGHEEIELSWRLIDAGWGVRYLADVEVFHPRTEISRHAEGWFLTGRNRVWIARRTLPWPIALVHVSFWLAVGTRRAPKGDCRSSYLRGWRFGWRGHIEHRPIRWSTVWRLTRLGRPPLI